MGTSIKGDGSSDAFGLRAGGGGSSLGGSSGRHASRWGWYAGEVQSTIADALRRPVGTPPLAELARGRRNACVLVCDVTRPVPNRLLLPPILRTLEEQGIARRDILILIATGLHRPTPTLSAETETALTAYQWPGNVRELRNAMERAIVLWPTPTIEPQALPEPMRGHQARLPQFGGDFTIDEVERRHVQAVLARTANLDEGARILGIDVSTLWRKRKKYESS